MRIRGNDFRRWRAGGRPSVVHDEIIPGGVQLSVEVRMVPHGVCAIFVSLYSRKGQELFEEMYATLHATPDEGAHWGVNRALDYVRANVLRLRSVMGKSDRDR